MKQPNATKSRPKVDVASIDQGVNPRAIVEVTLRPNAPFLWRIHPQQWDVWSDPQTGEPMTVPLLSKDIASNGLNGVSGLPEDPSIVDVIAKMADRIALEQSKGWVYIATDTHISSEFLPPGVGAGGYLRKTPTKTSTGATGYYWHDAFTTFSHDSQGRQIAVCSRPHLYRWLTAMIQASRTAKRGSFNMVPSGAAVEAVLAPLRSRLKVLEGSPATSDNLEKLEVVRKEIASIRSQIAEAVRQSAPEVEP